MVQDALRLHTNLAGGYHATWRTVFKNFARRPPVRRFWPGWRDSCRRGERPRNWTCWSRRWRLRPADHRGERGRFGTLLRLKTSWSQPVLIPTGRNLSAEAEPDRQRQHHHPPGRGDRHPGVLHGGGQVELQPAGLPGGRGGVPGQVAGGRRRASRQAWMRKEATAATRARSGVK